ncbi:hypothetical protein EVAR_5543_1 [Eumeta japonica]|uniref:Uncharacterized protein n=1 Tax=Eumeta variegata TaxID=151549 RepID=A0A4C1U226_EUMVA|nr:hypothetical protein EVAR_5543_1 [Eumeta japonica]
MKELLARYEIKAERSQDDDSDPCRNLYEISPRQLAMFKDNLRLHRYRAVAALHHSWTSATSGLRGLFLITCRQTFLRGLFLITCRQTFFVCEAPSGARPSAVADVADA